MNRQSQWIINSTLKILNRDAIVHYYVYPAPWTTFLVHSIDTDEVSLDTRWCTLSDVESVCLLSVYAFKITISWLERPTDCSEIFFFTTEQRSLICVQIERMILIKMKKMNSSRVISYQNERLNKTSRVMPWNNKIVWKRTIDLHRISLRSDWS